MEASENESSCPPSADNDSNGSGPWRRLAFLLAAVALSCLVAFAFYRAADFFFLLFTAALFGVFLNRCALAIAAKTPISRGWALGLIALLLFAVSIGALTMFGIKLEQKVSSASKQIDDAVRQLDDRLKEYPTLRSTVLSAPYAKEAFRASGAIPAEKDERKNGDEKGGDVTNDESSTKDSSDNNGSTDDPVAESSSGGSPGEAAAGAVQSEGGSSSSEDKSGGGSSGGVGANGLKSAGSMVLKLFATTFGAGMNFLIVIVLALYFGANPEVYRKGVIRLFPLDKRDRVSDILGKIEKVLWRWLLGRFATMLITGVLVGVMLKVLGVPMALTVGVITALLTFIPNIGAIVSLGLGLLLAAPQGLGVMGAVFGLYMGVQLLESYVLTPLIQKRQVSLPPGLLIAFQALMGLMFGFLGVMIASPLLAVVLVIVNQAYIQDTLGDHDGPEVVE